MNTPHVVLALAVLSALSCAGTDLSTKMVGFRGEVRKARQAGAYQCAPTDLAAAETSLEYAERLLDRGDYFLARDALDEAKVAIEKAQEKTRLKSCVANISAGKKQTRSLPAEDSKGTLDADGDGIPDHKDHCPAAAEDTDGFEDSDGCPDPDNDKDGVLDVNDACPEEAEDRDGFEDQDGCPDLDNDRDGILDTKDKCPIEPEDMDGFEDEDGCPELDNDHDGVVDQFDACPNEYGPEQPNGCPKKFEYIEVTSAEIELKQAIFFKTGKSTILAKSYPLLGEVALVLRSRPKLEVRIEGHTDTRGNRSQNLSLSQARADSVRMYLIGQGISGDRMDTKGYGPDRPIDSNKTAVGRERNRRVEFVITKQ